VSNAAPASGAPTFAITQSAAKSAKASPRANRRARSSSLPRARAASRAMRISAGAVTSTTCTSA